MAKNKYLVPFIISTAIAVLLLLIFVMQISNVEVNDVVCETCPEEKALMVGNMNSWGENLYDSGEYIFDVGISNYGYDEARSVEVTCEIYDMDVDGYVISEIPIDVVTKKIGNVASVSYKSVELATGKNSKTDDFSQALCFVSNCDNCEILEDRILD